MKNEKIRIQKAISAAGVMSRRKTEELILEGRVLVNGRKASIGMGINPKKDKVTVDGRTVDFLAPQDKKYYALYKPRGYITTMHDSFDRKIVTELVKDLDGRIYPVGRLDKNSEGLLIMTNDGEFANYLMHPKNEIQKVYRVTTRGGVKEEALVALSSGIVIDGIKTKPALTKILVEEPNRTVVQVVISEGRNRQIRKMFESLSLPVKRLKRIAVGPVRLGMLKVGEYRPLTGEEVGGLRNKAKAKIE